MLLYPICKTHNWTKLQQVICGPARVSSSFCLPSGSICNIAQGLVVHVETDFEQQELSGIAQDIAVTYPSKIRDEYIDAAANLRIPYWDWALDARMPAVINIPEVTVNAPNGSLTIKNPLYTYRFHPKPKDPDFPGDDPIAQYPSTVRCPDAQGRSQPGKANKQLHANADAITTLIYSLLTSQPQYGAFSNTGFSDSRGWRYNSIENMHNSIHTMVGLGGHV